MKQLGCCRPDNRAANVMPVMAPRSETEVGRIVEVAGEEIGSVEVTVDYSKRCGGWREGR